jgi:hypothetical protein
MNLQKLIDRWSAPKGYPARGELINLSKFLENPNDLSCMCAQGQILYEAGWSAESMVGVNQAKIDRDVAKILNISVSHSVLLRIINDSSNVNPALVFTGLHIILGHRWNEILNFWWYIDRMNKSQWTPIWKSTLLMM